MKKPNEKKNEEKNKRKRFRNACRKRNRRPSICVYFGSMQSVWMAIMILKIAFRNTIYSAYNFGCLLFSFCLCSYFVVCLAVFGVYASDSLCQQQQTKIAYSVNHRCVRECNGGPCVFVCPCVSWMLSRHFQMSKYSRAIMQQKHTDIKRTQTHILAKNYEFYVWNWTIVTKDDILESFQERRVPPCSGKEREKKREKQENTKLICTLATCA